MLCSLQTTLIHLGAKYAPCMRWDETLSREIKESRLKERDTACCIRKDRAGCVQSPKTECTKVGGEAAGGGGSEGGTVSMANNSPRSNWVSQSEPSALALAIRSFLLPLPVAALGVVLEISQ